MSEASDATALQRGAVKPCVPDFWLIEQLLEKGKLGVIYGRPKSGRSFVALDLAVAAANGETWFGRAVKQVPVSYVWNGEPSSCSRRLEALSKNGRRLPDTLRFFGGQVTSVFERSVFDGNDQKPGAFAQSIIDSKATDGTDRDRFGNDDLDDV